MQKPFWNIFVAVGAVLLPCIASADTAVGAQPTAEELAKMRSSMQEFKRFTREQAPVQICAQPHYLDCYRIEQDQCVAELKAITEQCQAKADEQIKTFTSGGDMKKYVEITGRCGMLEHGRKHGKDEQQALACVRGGPPAPTGADAQRQEAEAIAARLKPRLRKNAAYTLCDQPGYLNCFKISHEQCIADLSRLKDACVDQADATFKDFPNRGALMPYMGAVGSCLAMKHAERQPKADQAEVQRCINTFKIDPQQMDKSLTR
jgi:hypothetical protein